MNNTYFPPGSLVEVKETGVRLIVVSRADRDHKGEQLLSPEPVNGTGEWYKENELELIRAPAASAIFVADADVIDPEVEQTFREYWQEIVMKDGQWDLIQIKRELYDFYHMIDNVPKVYDCVTGGRISKPNTLASVVISAADDYVERLIEDAKRESDRSLEDWRDRTLDEVGITDWFSYGIDEEIAAAYLDSLNRHIAAVREAGLKLDVPLEQLNIHDQSKLSQDEFPFYARQFFGDKGDPDGFARAWLHHIHANPHHWNHWLFADGFTPKGSTVEGGAVPMPHKYIREMVADWMGAGYAYTGSWDMTEWLTENLPRIRLHSQTAREVAEILAWLGYDVLDILLNGKAIVKRD